MPKGIVVEHKETEIRFAISESNFNKKIHRKVRDLKPGETIFGYRPKRKPVEHEDQLEGFDTLDQPQESGDVPAKQPEGSSTEGTKAK